MSAQREFTAASAHPSTEKPQVPGLHPRLSATVRTYRADLARA
ncbi:hypothetical protein ACFCYM_08425 [Streptomyces sp. NPDC056254]